MCLAVPMKIEKLKDDGMAEVSVMGTVRDVAIDLTPQVQPGDYVLVHAGFAIEVVDEQYAIETLDDVIECINDPDFDTIIEDFLDKMPCSRESVEEMLETVSALDLWPVYNKLLTDCVALLSPEELAKLKADYKEKFSIPLPGEEE